MEVLELVKELEDLILKWRQPYRGWNVGDYKNGVETGYGGAADGLEDLLEKYKGK
jgi:hypothetical protein